MKFKKLLSIIITMCVLTLTVSSALPVTTALAADTTMEIGASKVYKDTENEITISLRNNTKTIAGIEVFVAFDTDTMNVNSVNTLLGSNWEIDYKAKSLAKYGRGIHCMLQDNTLSGFNNTDKQLFNIKFSASNAKLNTNYNFKVYVIDMCDANGNSIKSSVANAEKSLKCVDSSMVDIDICGLQYSYKRDGVRIISTVEPEINGKKVVEHGHVLGMVTGAISESDMYVRTDNYYVRSFAATSNGTLPVQMTESDTATNYVLTIINNGTSVKALTQKYMIRAYAKLSDGSYVYSDVCSYTIYNLAEVLYNNYLMPNQEAHDHLYNNILTVVNSNYKKVDYNWSGVIVK